MTNRKLARRYAAALGELAAERGILEQVESELELIGNALVENDEFKQFIENRRISPSAKREAIATAFASVSTVVRNFLSLVIDKHRERHLLEIFSEFVAYADTVRKVAAVEVTTAHPLSDDERKALEDKFIEFTGGPVRLSEKVDPSLLGGIQARIGDLVMDGSVTSRLERLRIRLQEVKFNSGIDFDNGVMANGD